MKDFIAYIACITMIGGGFAMVVLGIKMLWEL